jgi:hypothetical protein
MRMDRDPDGHVLCTDCPHPIIEHDAVSCQHDSSSCECLVGWSDVEIRIAKILKSTTS